MTECVHSVSTIKMDRTRRPDCQVRSCSSAEGVGFEPTMKLTPHSDFQDRLRTCRLVSHDICWGRLGRSEPRVGAGWCRLMLLFAMPSVSIVCPSSAALGLPERTPAPSSVQTGVPTATRVRANHAGLGGPRPHRSL
jgi:hypothetical protein